MPPLLGAKGHDNAMKAAADHLEEEHGPGAWLRMAVAPFAPLAPRVLFGLRLASSASLALFVTYYLELQNSFWAATTAVIVCQPSLGASLQKGRYRAIGTVVGALVMVTLLGLFPQQRNALIFCLALWCGLCGFLVVMLRNFAAYAAALAGITATIIFADTLSDPTTAFFLGVIRVSEICIGIGAAALVMLLTDFGVARRQLAGLLQHTAAQMSAGFLLALSQDDETAGTRAARRDVVRTLGPLNAAIDAATGESSYLHAHRGNLRATLAALLDALVAWRNVGHHRRRPGGDDAELSRELASRLARIDPTQIAGAPLRARETCQEVIAGIKAIRSADPTHCTLVDAARDVAICLAAITDAVILLGGGRAPRRRPAVQPLIIADPLPALLGGARAFAAVLCVAVFWIVTAWPNGPFAIVFAAIATLIFGSFGDQGRALARDYTIGAALIALLGGVLYFGVLPALSSFPALVALLFLLFVPLGMMQAGTWHNVLFLAMSIASLPLLGLGNPIAYDASSYLNLALAIIAGSTTGTLFFVAMPVVDPQVRTRRLIAFSLRDFRRLACRRRPGDMRRWSPLLTQRLEAMPPQASAEQSGELLTLLALGKAVIRLIDGVRTDEGQRALDEALDALAEGRLAPARQCLTRLELLAAGTPSPPPEAGATREVHLRAQIAVITDAIDDHAALLTARIDARGLFSSSFR